MSTMRTFARKPQASQRTMPAKSTIPIQPDLGRSREVNWFLHLQRTIGNHAVQRLLQAQPDVGEAGYGAGHDPRSLPAEPLNPATRAFLEPRLGYDFAPVRVHTGPKAAESARQMGARAYT